MIAVCWIAGPIRICVVRGYDRNGTAWLGNSIEFRDEGHNIRHMLDYVPTDDLVEFIIGKRIRNIAEIMNYICVCLWIRIYADRAWRFVPATTDIKDFFLRSSGVR